MYIESIQFKRKKNSKWEKGLYVGKTCECEDSVILDSHFQPVVVTDVAHKVHSLEPSKNNHFRLTLG